MTRNVETTNVKYDYTQRSVDAGFALNSKMVAAPCLIASWDLLTALFRGTHNISGLRILINLFIN
jgi:hypothetical protein